MPCPAGVEEIGGRENAIRALGKSGRPLLYPRLAHGATCTLSFPGRSVTVASPGARRQKMARTKMGVVGCGGRMGRMLVAEIVASEGCALAGGCAKPGDRKSTRLNSSHM